MLKNILEGCQGQSIVPRHGALPADRTPSKLFKHTFLLLGMNIAIK